MKNRKYRFLRRFLRVFFALIILIGLLLLFIRSPWGQSIILDKAVNYVTNKTNTKVSVDKLFLTFNGALQIKGLYLEDTKGDTLIYSKSLEANLPLLAMIKGGAVGVDNLEWDGLRANIKRKDTVSGYNFNFLIDAFASKDTPSSAKDTATKPLNIVIGTLDLKNINIVFDDEVVGIDSHFIVGNLTAKLKEIDVEKMIFNADKISLSNSSINLIQKPIKKATSDTTTPLPFLSVDRLIINNVNTYYQSKADKIIADIKIDSFYTEVPEIDLSKKQFKLTTLQLKNSKVLLQTASSSSKKTSTDTASASILPDLNLQIDDVLLENNKIHYFVDNAKIVKDVFNTNAIALENFTFKGSDIFLEKTKAALQLEQFSFKEKSSFNLKKFALNAAINDKNLEISNIEILLNKNRLFGHVKANYKSLSQLMSSPEKTNVQLNIPSFNIWLATLFKFQPKLRENEYLDKLSKKDLRGTLKIDGSLANLTISNTKVHWGNFTSVSLNGTIKNSTDIDLLKLNIPNFKAATKRDDLLKIVDEKALGINLPEDILIAGSINGTLKNITTNTQIKTSQGLASIKGNFKNNSELRYNTSVKIDNYNIGSLLNNPKFSELSVTLNSKGNGKNIANLNASLNTTISKFQLDNYVINDLNINGDIKNGKGKINSKYKDENINLDLNAFVNLDSITTEATIDLNLIGANLQGLGVMQRNVKTGLELALDFKGNVDKYAIESNIKNGVVVYDRKTYLMGSLNAKAFVDKDTTALAIDNKMIQLNLESNTDPATFSKILKRHVASYFYRDVNLTDTITNPVNLKLKAKISQTPLIKDVFLVNLKDLDTINIAVDFKERERKLIANITAPHINFSGSELDSLSFSMNTDKEDFNFKLGFNNITAGPLNIPRTIISGLQKDNKLALNFLGYHQEKKLMNVNTNITGNREKLKFTVLQDSLVLNSNLWKIPKTNAVIFENEQLTFTDFKISKGLQSIEITDKNPAISANHIALKYTNFQIDELFNYLNPKKEITTGILNGDFILEKPFTDTGIIANLDISQLKLLKTDLGKLTMNAKSLGSSKYDFNVGLKEGDIDLDVKGDYVVNDNDANLNLNLLINEFKMKALNTLTFGEVKESSGNFSGKFKVTGKTSEPKYNGNINFNNAVFNITKLNTKFTLQNETLNVDNSGLSMTDFTVLDAEKNSLVLSGDIKTKTFVNPAFNLDIKANNFRILNATEKDNEFLYGKASFNADAKLTGDLQIPKLNAKLVVSSDTDVTYVMPYSQANIEERDGVVAFVNRENHNAILTQTEEETATITGFDIKSLLKINKKASVTVIINPETGDNFKASGAGDLIFRMKPNGRLSLTGAYEIDNGHYELNLYNIVDRKFTLAPGSSISWAGDPLDAKLDVRAIYNVETSAAPLMASQVSGQDSSIRNKYKQVIPFNVYLNIDGELLQPKISFNLDMPKDEQGAIGGQVYGRVQQVNQQEDELNRQVFSLLVLNRFYPDAGSDGSSGGFASIARDNLNDAVSGQLNSFSDKILGGSGIELDFGLNSFTDYQGDAPTDRTQLDIAAQKKLFNDRLIVRVGSEVDIQGSSPNGEKSPIIGNVSLEYKITEDGRYRFRGFRKSEFENVIDGQTIVNGVALIFTKEFNEFQQLWDSILRSSKEKEVESEKKEIEKSENKK